MKTIFVATNFTLGMLTLLFGSAFIVSGTHNLVAVSVGVLAMVLAAMCIWLAKEAALHNQRQ